MLQPTLCMSSDSFFTPVDTMVLSPGHSPLAPASTTVPAPEAQTSVPTLPAAASADTTSVAALTLMPQPTSEPAPEPAPEPQMPFPTISVVPPAPAPEPQTSTPATAAPVSPEASAPTLPPACATEPALTTLLATPLPPFPAPEPAGADVGAPLLLLSSPRSAAPTPLVVPRLDPIPHAACHTVPASPTTATPGATASTGAPRQASAWVAATARSGDGATPHWCTSKVGSVYCTRSNGGSPATAGLGAPTRRDGALHLQPGAGRGVQVILPPTLKREAAGEPTRLRDARPKFQSKSEQHIVVTSVHYSPFFEENKHERQNPLYEPRDCFDDDI